MNDQEDTELSAAIKLKMIRYDAPLELRMQILAAVDQHDRLSTATPQKRFFTSWRLHWAGIGLAFTFGVIASVATMLFQSMSGEADHVPQELVANHIRSLMVTHLSDVISSDQHTVKPWFNGKLDFSPPVHDLASEGFPLLGGRLDYVDQHSIAALIYGRQQHKINLFIWPSKKAASQITKSLNRQGFNVVEWNDSGMQFWAVSDLNAQDLQNFSQLLLRKP